MHGLNLKAAQDINYDQLNLFQLHSDRYIYQGHRLAAIPLPSILRISFTWLTCKSNSTDIGLPVGKMTSNN